ncbi:putative bifunctional diguanylate cyclase/phosphodiesterase [Minwuia thermotolerans]|uniref:GGDEF-domain containing protein n=1 Tax=Minwuia thermotolerans TaxID=2056226 RepID=A0A2M9FZA6_9PROT|nr:bifunctional diguanylate cyclase/phosphodiesterase [Minwuia thermotolerans]PJK28769.1 GGDEF-domain containing protein [Minwuia thermotolerans]
MIKGRFQVLTIAKGASVLDNVAPRLSISGARVVTERVTSAEEAAIALDVGDYDCILFDVGSDPAPAKELQASLLDSKKKVPLLVISDRLASNDMVDLLRSDIADCINSDELKIDRLVRAIWNATRASRTERALDMAESQRSFNALHDGLTGLPNRSLFFDRLDQAITFAERQREPVALLTLNINGFNRINGEMGHKIGDILLQQLADRMKTALRRSDTLARIGDDEFAGILPTGATNKGAEKAARKLINALEVPFEINDHSFTIGVRIGLAFYPQHATCASDLMIRAENAMRDGRRTNSRFAINIAGDGAHEASNRPLVEDLRRALNDGDRQLFVTFQPKIDLRKGRVDGVEALVRWRHPARGLVFPDAFIPLAEDAGLIDRLTLHVLNHSLAQQAAWRAEGIDLSIAVNVSAKTLQNPRLPLHAKNMIEAWSADPSRVIFEITESAIILDVERATATLQGLDRLGVGISIDDFGTGYTCLSYIRRLPVEEIKVDKSFVMGMSKSPDDWVIVSSLIELGHNLGLSVVAEGVEDARTLAALTELGCDVAQGYHMSRPLPADDLVGWLVNSPWGPESALRLRPSAKESDNVHQLHLTAGS